MKKFTTLMAALVMMLALAVPYVAAQEQPQKPRDEAAVYAEWYNAYYKEKDLTKTYTLAKELIDKFPGGKYDSYAKKSRTDIRAKWFNDAKAANNVGEEIRIAKEEFAENGDNLNYLHLLIVDIRTNEMEKKNYAHGADLVEFVQKANKIIEEGKTSELVPADKSKVFSAYYYQSHAMVEGNNKNSDKALELYKKSSSIDPATTILNAQNNLAIGVIYNDRFQAASDEFDKLSEDIKKDAENPTTKAALEKLNSVADLALDAWARFLVNNDSSKWGQVRTNVENRVKDLYKFRHEEKLDGFDEWLAKYKTGTAANGAPSNGSSGSN
ncbi:MAG: hypothetical protein AB1757_08380 [Acidobacteriota bacterium]